MRSRALPEKRQWVWTKSWQSSGRLCPIYKRSGREARGRAKQPADREVVSTRVFNALRKLVFRAFPSDPYLPVFVCIRHWTLATAEPVHGEGGLGVPPSPLATARLVS